MPYKDPAKHSAYQAARCLAKRTAWLAENGPCVECGSWERLEVDHIDPALKVSHRIWNWSEAKRQTELAKCQILCYDCHKKKTAKDVEAEHGTNGRYTSHVWKCRCRPCRDAHAAVNAKYRK